MPAFANNATVNLTTHGGADDHGRNYQEIREETTGDFADAVEVTNDSTTTPAVTIDFGSYLDTDPVGHHLSPITVFTVDAATMMTMMSLATTIEGFTDHGKSTETEGIVVGQVLMLALRDATNCTIMTRMVIDDEVRVVVATTMFEQIIASNARLGTVTKYCERKAGEYMSATMDRIGSGTRQDTDANFYVGLGMAIGRPTAACNQGGAKIEDIVINTAPMRMERDTMNCMIMMRTISSDEAKTAVVMTMLGDFCMPTTADLRGNGNRLSTEAEDTVSEGKAFGRPTAARSQRCAVTEGSITYAARMLVKREAANFMLMMWTTFGDEEMTVRTTTLLEEFTTSEACLNAEAAHLERKTG